MTGPEHYRAAEELLGVAATAPNGSDLERYALEAAGVHAGLAHAAATALDGDYRAFAEWAEVAQP